MTEAQPFRSVAGLLVLSQDGEGPFALLQRRGEWDYEKERWESYPGCCQVTCSGGIEDEDKDDTREAMLREAEQELGPVFLTHILAAGPQHLITVRTDRLNREATFYWVQLPAGLLTHISLHPSTGGLVRFRPGQTMIDMSLECTRKGGTADRKTIAAFPETHQAVERAFLLTQP